MKLKEMVKFTLISIVAALILFTAFMVYATSDSVTNQYQARYGLNDWTSILRVNHIVANTIKSKKLNNEVPICDLSAYNKPFEDYRAIVDKSSQAYQLVATLNIGEHGLLYTSDGYIAVALSGQYGGIGTKYQVTLSSGMVINVIIADIKSQSHLTNNCTDSNGAMIEFVTDSSRLPSEVWQTGSLDCMFKGTITKLERK